MDEGCSGAPVSTMPLYLPSITIDAVIEALGAFLQPFVGTAEIVRARVNRVSPPTDPYVQLNEVGIYDIETPHRSFPLLTDDSGKPIWSSAGKIEVIQGVINITGPARIDIQADFYGPSAGDQCKAVKGIFRTSYATQQFPDGIAPLYCSDGMQSPLITGEEQFDNRWTLTMSLQYNAAVTLPYQSATELTMNVIGDLP